MRRGLDGLLVRMTLSGLHRDEVLPGYPTDVRFPRSTGYHSVAGHPAGYQDQEAAHSQAPLQRSLV